jgi:hypothetical protein
MRSETLGVTISAINETLPNNYLKPYCNGFALFIKYKRY